MRRRLAEARRFLPDLDDPVDELQAFVCQLMLAQQDDRAATVAFSREIVRSASEPVMAEVRRMRDEYSAVLVEILERGVSRSAFAEVDPRLDRTADLRHGQLGLDLVRPRRPQDRGRDRRPVQPHPDRRPGAGRRPRRRRLESASPPRSAPRSAPTARAADVKIGAVVDRHRRRKAPLSPAGARQGAPIVVAAVVVRGEDGGRDSCDGARRRRQVALEVGRAGSRRPGSCRGGRGQCRQASGPHPRARPGASSRSGPG